MEDYRTVIREFDPISLDEMNAVKLMNRIDTKFVVPMRLLSVLLRKSLRDYYVQEIDSLRVATYDTMYFDTEDLDMYLRHHDRQLVRQKIRVRQYVDSHLNFLEIKRKNNKGRTKKKRIPLPQPDISIPTDEVVDFIAAKSRYTYEQISPKLRTAFHRITLVNKQKTERLTIDLDLAFYNQSTGIVQTLDDVVIVELKRDGNCFSPMIGIMLSERVKPLKISKYCIGTALTTPYCKYNRFKKKIRAIQKLSKL